MSFLSSVSSYFGGSAKHAKSATTHLSNAGDAAYKSGSSVLSGASNFFSSTTAVAGGAAWNTYEWIAGKIIGTNTATQFANSFANLFGGTKATGWLASATEFAALSLVKYPVSCMAVLVTTTIVATHPKETFEAVKGFGKAVYNFLDAGLELTEAVGEAALALGLKGAELLDPIVDSLMDTASDAGVGVVDILKDVVDSVDIEMDTFKETTVDPLGGIEIITEYV